MRSSLKIALVALFGLLSAFAGFAESAPATPVAPLETAAIAPPIAAPQGPLSSLPPVRWAVEPSAHSCIPACTNTFNDCVACGGDIYSCQPVYDECFNYCKFTGNPLWYPC
jgi:hypothetical protein